MLDSRASARRDAAALGTLIAAYSAFRFSHEQAVPRGHRYAARRRNGTDPGLHTIITSNLAEMRDALAADQARHGR